MRDDDVLFYNDATGIFIDNMDFGHVCLMDQNKLDFGLFSVIWSSISYFSINFSVYFTSRPMDIRLKNLQRPTISF